MTPARFPALEKLDLWKETKEALTLHTEVEWRQDAGGSLNPAQEASIARLMNRYFERHCLSRPERYEFKEVRIHELAYGSISVVLEVGSRTDEGTMASVLCRSRVHAFIGRKGGFRAPVTGARGGHGYEVGLAAVLSLYK
jgi:hypothetical protein